MIPAGFDYLQADSVEGAIALKAGTGEDAKYLAGGHSLIPLMKFRLAVPTALIDISRLAELGHLQHDDATLRLGAGLTFRELESSPVVREHLPLLAAAAASVGDRQVRARATIGGSVVHGDPAGDVPAVLLALDATMVLRGPGGEREISVHEFFLDFWETAAQPDEILVDIRVPALAGQQWGFVKFRQRSQDWATVGVAAQQRADGRWAVALVNMAATPLRARAVEEALAGGSTAEEAAERASEGTTPPTDLRADAEYRRHLARVLSARALTEAGVGGP